jgi:hypothetical protein
MGVHPQETWEDHQFPPSLKEGVSLVTVGPLKVALRMTYQWISRKEAVKSSHYSRKTLL